MKPLMRGRYWRSLPWVVVVTAAATLAVLLVLAFLLVVVSRNQAVYEQYYSVLRYTNLAAGTVLSIVIAWVLLRLLTRLRKGKFGARLMLKLAAIFALVGFLPGLLIYAVSTQFVARSIESWFDARVESALQSGVDLGVNSLDTLRADLREKARVATNNWGEVSAATGSMERLREQLSASEAQLWTLQGRLLASSGASTYALLPEKPSAEVLQELRSARTFTQLEGFDESTDAGMQQTVQAGRIHLWAMVQSGAYAPDGPVRLLHVVQQLSPELMRNALQVQDAYREYKQRALARSGLRSMYIGTLTLSLILAVLGAVLLAIVLANQLMRPLLLLSEGVAKVAAGDLQAQSATARLLSSNDELSELTQSFAQMTQQLAQAQSKVQTSMTALEEAHTYLQTILDNQSAAVLVLNEKGLLLSANAGATRVLREPLAAYIGQPLAQIPKLAAFAADVQTQFATLEQEWSQSSLQHSDHWEHAYDLQEDEDALPGDTRRTILARGAFLPLSLQVMREDFQDSAFAPQQGQRLLVIDDISAMVSAQRSQAWAEVARRLAHEIKNPLTPIQLSAERLHMKLDGKLPENEQGLLNKSVRTIVDQVDALKRMVNEFRDYARLPGAQLTRMDLNALIGDVLQLYAASECPITAELTPDLPPIMGDAQQLRQVIHNLLQNAQDAALAAASAEKPAKVSICTQLSSSGERVRLLVRDNGAGFPAHILQRAFEPYITTKAKGTGLGLAVVKKIMDDHQARIDISNLHAAANSSAELGNSLLAESGKNAAQFALGSVEGAQVALSFAKAV